MMEQERLRADVDHEARLQEEAKRKRAEKEQVQMRVWLKDEHVMAFGRCR